MSDDIPGTRPADPPDSLPVDDLAEVWQMLDELPAAPTPVDLTATTMELVAVRAAGDTGQFAPAPSPRSRRLWPLAALVAGLLAGVVIGRGTGPDPDRRVLEHLPLIEHLGLLQEAGSVEFLGQLVGRMEAGQGPMARGFGFPRDPESLRAEAREFDAALESLRAELAGSQTDREPLGRRRERVTSLEEAELAALEKSAATFEALAAVDRRRLARLAQTLADPKATAVHEAARLWHMIVAATNPAFRRNVIEMETAERLEWLNRSAGRPESWSPGRGPGGLPTRRPPFRSPWPPRPAGPREAPAETRAPPD